MLQDGSLPPPLGTPRNLVAIEHNISDGTALETKEGCFRRGNCLIAIVLDYELSRNVQSGERLDERFMKEVDQPRHIELRSAAKWQCQAVGEFSIVQDCAAAGASSHDVAIATGGVRLAVFVTLEVSERECGALPLIEPQGRDVLANSGVEQVFVDRHIPNPIAVTIGN